MFARIVFLVITAFWLTMNVLLWRSEYGSRDTGGNPVPVEIVWKKILTAPDASSLTILKHGERVGFCHWMTSVGEEFSKMDEAPPEGMIGRVGQYKIVFEGNVNVPDWGSRVRFESSLQLGQDRAWQEVSLRLAARPQVIEFIANAARRTLRVRGNDGEKDFDRTLRLADLQDPEALLREFGVASPLVFLQGLALPPLPGKNDDLDAGLKWDSRETTLKIGHEPVRLYRLRTKLLDRYEVTIYVSRVGEILRAELPGEIQLVHDSLLNFQTTKP